YGSMRHMLVQFALKWSHVPDSISELVFRYYDSVFLNVITEEWCSDYFHLEIGVPPVLLHIVFDVGFQVVLDMWSGFPAARILITQLEKESSLYPVQLITTSSWWHRARLPRIGRLFSGGSAVDYNAKGKTCEMQFFGL